MRREPRHVLPPGAGRFDLLLEEVIDETVGLGLLGPLEPLDSLRQALLELLLEHDPPVVTVTKRVGAAAHVLASDAVLSAHGIEKAETDRGGDVTYHGPGQLVAYPILDIQRLGLKVHPYVRWLEQCLIDTIAEDGLAGMRDPAATGVWVGADGRAERKVAAIGVRLSRFVALHGFALNVSPDLSHFGLIVPCGLARPVTSLAAELGARAPSIDAVKRRVAAWFAREVDARLREVDARLREARVE